VTDEEKFVDFMARYRKSYEPREYKLRFEIFKRNMAIAERLNEKSPSADYGITLFMDLSPEEFKAQYLNRGMNPSSKDYENNEVYTPPSKPLDLPSSFDWSSKGALTRVYNQGQCGSCWAFSTTENIESVYFLAGNPLLSLSMQQIVDCDPYDSGCNGGNPSTAYRYVIEAGGLESYSDYPYTAEDGRCKFDKSKVVANISSWQWVTRVDDENAMQSFTYTTAPPSICVDASTWQYYQGGVITKNDGCGTQLDHCVQLAGWEQKNSMTVWIVRNSWGITWGNAGYLYIEKGYNVCGIGQECSSSIVK